MLAASHASGADFDTYREALISGDQAHIAALIAGDDKVLPVDPDGVTVLHKALHIYSPRRLAIVQQLIAAGADVNAAARDGCNEDGDTPLFSARPETAFLLIAAGERGRDPAYLR